MAFIKLNRHGRRTEVALKRKKVQMDRVFKGRRVMKDEATRRRDARERRLDKVRARTAERKSKALKKK